MVEEWPVNKISCNGNLGYNILLSIIHQFHALYGTFPVTLIISPLYLDEAYKIVSEMQLTKLVIVPVPGLPPYFWAVSNLNGLIYAEGL